MAHVPPQDQLHHRRQVRHGFHGCYLRLIALKDRLVLLFFAVTVGCVSMWDDEAVGQPPVTPRKVVNLIADPEFEDFTFFTNSQKTLETRREKIWWINADGHLHVGGKGWGYLRTNQRYRDYHCVVEYKWGERTWGPRADAARNCGLMVHAFGNDGGHKDSWIRSLESQMVEGGSGDILVLNSELTAEVQQDRNGDSIWETGGPSTLFRSQGRSDQQSEDIWIGWKDRSPNWSDTKGFRGQKDIENPVGEWNRMEVICRGDSIQIYLNGVLVNAGRGAKPSEGYIAVQSALAECIIRRYELHPLDSFKESWKPVERSTDTGYSVSGESILPREFPLRPEESQKLWQIDSDKYEMQLVAAEPITCDPVDVVWDRQGRMFVAEMGDYPTPASLPGFLSRIRLLRDRDGDGRMDQATTWADDLDHVQGLLPFRDGLIATTHSAILFLQDTDNDGRADRRETLFRTNEPRHSQLQVACPRWGLDNAIYFTNGIDGKEIYPVNNPDNKLTFARFDLRYDPYTDKLDAITGRGQFGNAFDAFGRRFFCSNRNPTMFAVMPREAVRRNPLAGIISGYEDIQPPGAPVWPLNLSHTTSSAHAGTHTSACGLAVYRADLMPELTGDIFVCDPTAQLITRNRVVGSGASFRAERVGEKRDFLVSGDEWCRPVHARVGPDGALYICDMYRRFIDHAQYFPEDFQKTHYMRAGLDHGRIWRLVPKGQSFKTPKLGRPNSLPSSVAGLVAEFESSSGWRRTHAQRVLVERNEAATVELLEKLVTESPIPTARVHGMWTLQALGRMNQTLVLKMLSDDNPGVMENAIVLAARHFRGEEQIAARLAELMDHKNDRIRFLAAVYAIDGRGPPSGARFLKRGPEDVWMRRAFASAFPKQAASTLIELLSDRSFISEAKPGHAETLEYVAMLVAANEDLDGIANSFERLSEETTWVHFAILSGINSGLRKSQLQTKSLAALVARPPARVTKATPKIKRILSDAGTLALDRDRSEVDRIAALPLVAQQGFARAAPVIEALLRPSESSTVQSAACRSMARFNRVQVAEFFFLRWKDLPPTPQREAIALMTSNTVSGLALMKRMKGGEIPRALMPPMSRWSYGRSANPEIKALAIELFGQGSGNRAQVIDKYRAALGQHRGDPERGRSVFVKATCIQCHKLGEKGADVGPSLSDVKLKPPAALLTDILDPNRAVEQRWTSATIITDDGLTLSGIVQADDAAGVTLRMPLGVTKTIPRREIEVFTASGKSLMPEGLERTISVAEMADLIAFLKQR